MRYNVEYIAAKMQDAGTTPFPFQPSSSAPRSNPKKLPTPFRPPPPSSRLTLKSTRLLQRLQDIFQLGREFTSRTSVPGQAAPLSPGQGQSPFRVRECLHVGCMHESQPIMLSPLEGRRERKRYCNGKGVKRGEEIETARSPSC